MSQFTDDYLRGLGMSAHNNALAYGYSITVTASWGSRLRAYQFLTSLLGL